MYIFFYIHSTAPSGFPQDVSVGNILSQSVELSWNPPLHEERNGIITGYDIVVTRRGTDFQFLLTSTVTMVTLNQLDPFTTYTVMVVASTSVGAGPPTSQLSFTTAEDGNNYVFN